MTTPAGLLHASPSELLDTAKHLSAKDDGDRHWSHVAIVVGRVEDERLYEPWGFPSARVFAEEELGLPPRDFVTMLELWRVMQAAQPAVAIEQWRQVSKAKALLVRKVMALGGDPATWVPLAMHTKTVTQFRAAVEEVLGKAEWVTFRCGMPGELAELVEAALVLALPKALDEPQPDPKRARDRNTRFRCLEVIVTEFVQQNAMA